MASARNGEMSLISWSNLPEDLLASIGKRMEDHFDIVRFRAVCHSWRCSIAAPSKFPPLPLELHFLTHDHVHPIATFSVSRRTVFRLELPAEYESSQAPFNNAWLIKVQEEEDGGKVRLINPFSRFPMKTLLDSFPKELNLLNFRLKQISTTFSIERSDPFDSSDEGSEDDEDEVDREGPMSCKVAFSRGPRPNDVNSHGVFSIIGGELYSMRIGDELWTSMDCADTYRDITNYKGNVFAVIRNGICSKNNGASLSMTHLVLPPRSFSGERYLVESCGDLFLVSRDFTTCLNLIYYDNDYKCFVKREGATEIPFKFEVFKMNNISPSPMVFQWEAVSNLGDRIFCVSRDCSYSVAAQDFPGCKGNCIYFVDELVDVHDYVIDDNKIFVYNLEDGSAAPLLAFPGLPNIFWPPRACLSSSGK
ncbi:hypothetical protein P3X46_027266 [Hevea brasiliensis]|uniref:KIB1-4 beta-propeller domain-containing protein n=1 Tax=Hevea brasiliensis TaxID=3981 RepID=A0ABQ9L0T4_HEVBR|nr:F-box protein At2g26160-like [Hevea brasiliensis]KAJ9153876.1 hypothetical protein P3X46_027266 [Hevea brasiliensis]